MISHISGVCSVDKFHLYSCFMTGVKIISVNDETDLSIWIYLVTYKTPRSRHLIISSDLINRIEEKSNRVSWQTNALIKCPRHLDKHISVYETRGVGNDFFSKLLNSFDECYIHILRPVCTTVIFTKLLKTHHSPALKTQWGVFCRVNSLFYMGYLISSRHPCI